MEEKTNLKLLQKRFAGNNMKLFFGSSETKPAEKVLVLSNLVAFINNEVEAHGCYLLQTREGGSVYGLDMSMRLKNPAYKDFHETFLFIEKSAGPIVFRALSEKSEWRDYTALTTDELNY